MLIIGPNDTEVSHRNILDFHILRKAIFADGYKWDVCTSGAYEFDQYDIPEARYVIAYFDGTCVGGARIIPCNLSYAGPDGRPYTYMLNDFCFGSLSGIFPSSSLHAELPVSDSAWEMTRFIASTAGVTKALLDQVHSYLSQRGANEVITISPVQMPRVLSRNGYRCDILSSPVTYHDKSYVALSTKVGAMRRLRVRRNDCRNSTV